MKIKVCGMKRPENIEAVQQCEPDFMGFIFYKKSARYVEENISSTLINATNSKTVGVFVNSTINEVKATVAQYNLDYVQLHGDESLDFVKELFNADIQIIKALRINDDFEWSIIQQYAPFVSYFLFDTGGKKYGGNGYKFDWTVLKNYKETKPFILSGGIGPEDIEKIKELNIPELQVIDINSKFEIKPGLKDIELVKRMINEVRNERIISSK